MSSDVLRVLAFVFVLAAASACTVAAEQHPVPVRAHACSAEFAPVCARRGSELRNFTNSCLARASGFQVMYRGQCSVSARPVPPVACTREFAPVCARRDDQQRTFDNPCLARASGFQVMYRGQCRASVGPLPNQPIACTREFAPVCARRGNLSLTFDNACLARADGFRLVHTGRCR
jgi:Kazal-type serine protease inhibitor-like protein